MVGNTLSATVTEKLHVFELPAPSMALQVTLLVPLGKLEPLGNPLVLMTVGAGIQLSVAVTA